MGGETAGQEKASKYTKQGVNTLKRAEADLLANPNFLIGQQRGYELGVNPFTFDPTTVQNMKNTGTENAYGAFGGQLNDIRERATAGQGARSGTTMGMERRAAMGLGSDIANLNRTVDTQSALARPDDIMRSIQAQMPILQQRYQFARDIANAYTGAASNPVWSQPSPIAQAGAGLGGLGGVLLGSK